MQESDAVVVQNHAGAGVGDEEIWSESESVVEHMSFAQELEAAEGKCLEVKGCGSGGHIAGKTEEQKGVKEREKGDFWRRTHGPCVKSEK